MILKDCTRVEVIKNGKGRLFTEYDFDGAEISIQDEGTTLKIFVGYPLSTDDEYVVREISQQAKERAANYMGLKKSKCQD